MNGNGGGRFTREDAVFILDALESSSAHEVLIEVEGLHLHFRRGDGHAASAGAPVAAPAAAPATAPAPAAAEAPAPAAAVTATDDVADGERVLSPAAGTFYRAPSPTEPPFVEVGDVVEEGQTLAIVEAMKLMMSVPSPVSGVVRQIRVGNAEPVGFDEVLIVVEARRG